MIKRITAVLILTVFVFSMAGCGKDSEKGTAVHHVSRVTETTASAAQKSTWTYGYAKDKYGDYTSQAAAVCTVRGTFSNSATNNSDLVVEISAQKSNSYHKIRFQLWEYGSYIATVSDHSSRNSFLKVTAPSGQTKEFMIFGSDGNLYIDGYGYASEDELIDILTNYDSSEWSVVINGYNVPSTYHFSVDHSGFKGCYNKT